MNRVGFIYHPEYLNHDTGPGHPERPDRLREMIKFLLGRPVWSKLTHVQPAAAPKETVLLVHRERYVAEIERRCRAGDRVLDEGDTRVCNASFDIALLAAGGVVQGVEQVVSGTWDSCFCAVRPPGHHAETNRAMGFCLLNNVAVGARFAQWRYGLKRVAIVDWDVHHGNGTQEIFYSDPDVLYISLHQYPYYPGSGAETETGAGPGIGSTLNCPMRAGSGETEYLGAFRNRILPAIGEFRPELIMISAGFDAHKDDPLADIRLTEETYRTMTRMLRESAREHCGGKIVSVLEGGYDLAALSRSVEAHLETLVE